MPFTLSHPVYAVVLRKTVPSFSFTGLALGSMIPDMEYFMAMDTFKTIGHSIPGFLLLGLPLSISIAYAFHNVMKPVVPRLLPSAGGLDRYAAQRLGGRWKPEGVTGWFVFLISLFIGYLDHLFLDGMSHTGGWLVNEFPGLRRTVAGIKGYSWLQYFLSLVGLAIPLRWLYKDWLKWRKNEPQVVRPLRRSPYGRKFGPRFMLLLSAAMLFTLKMKLTPYPADNVMLLVSSSSALLFGWYAASLFHSGSLRGAGMQRMSALLALLAIMAVFKAARAAAGMIVDSSIPQLVLWIAFIWTWSAAVWIISRRAAEGAGWPWKIRGRFV
ncbi:DUF4184 family protein [Paenibacillus beijingensis]|uniref:DUF4184 family protein n=1 Tax=Paenibacillus beijingensis TaxID=1126833 RepID=A0A0D5NMX5_9BACL|nr:DUF4184 family protein [Paenibacillus beijingensis]AJY76649.1 hypothetical protein VN24_21310 [Paenibacillus beijingensis]